MSGMTTGEAALDFPFLSLGLWLPLLVGLPLVLLAKNRNAIALGALGATVLQAAITILLTIRFDRQASGYQFVESADWIPALGISYKLGVDGISILMVLLTGILGPLVVGAGWLTIHRREREFFASLIVLQTAMLGVFIALDFILFYVFWELVLIPMYLLIGIWGHERRIYATIKFFLYTFAGSVLMLVAILALRLYTGTFDIEAIPAEMADASRVLQRWVFVAFFFAFAIKVPMFPFHTWLPDAHVEAPTAGSMILAGVLLKMGAYGFLRFVLPMTPDAVDETRGLMIGLSLAAIIYGALVAMVQTDLKKLVAYSSVSHMGFVTLGIFTATATGLDGAILQMLSHGLVSPALFFAVGVVYERTHTRQINELGGLASRMPIYAAIFGFFMLASLGLPMLSGFVGEFLVLVSAFEYAIPVGSIAALGVILAAAYMLWMYQRVVLGNIRNQAILQISDVGRIEIVTFIGLAVLVVWIGILPDTFVQLLSTATSSLVGQP